MFMCLPPPHPAAQPLANTRSRLQPIHAEAHSHVTEIRTVRQLLEHSGYANSACACCMQMMSGLN
eukprot:365942-Chlamydomonas_euryale.AAC.85